MKDYQGGFSNEVYNSRTFRRYINSSVVAGYIGASNRSVKKDRIIENELRNQGLREEGVALWLTSTDGRHLMDESSKTLKRFCELVEAYTKNAFVDVAVWSHPDHSGRLKDSIFIRQKLEKLLQKKG